MASTRFDLCASCVSIKCFDETGTQVTTYVVNARCTVECTEYSECVHLNHPAGFMSLSSDVKLLILELDW